MLLLLSGCLVGNGVWVALEPAPHFRRDVQQRYFPRRYWVTGIQSSREIMLPSEVYFAGQLPSYEL